MYSMFRRRKEMDSTELSWLSPYIRYWLLKYLLVVHAFSQNALKFFYTDHNSADQGVTLPKYVSQISPGPNYDYYSSTMRFTISSPIAWLLALVILPARSNMMICVGLITYLALVSVLIT
ncbi:hypothetical protein CsSME_00041275 [Camellia sinensis var. sinensis]